MIDKDREKRKNINKLLRLEQNIMMAIHQEAYEILLGHNPSDIASRIEYLLEDSDLKIVNDKKGNGEFSSDTQSNT